MHHEAKGPAEEGTHDENVAAQSISEVQPVGQYITLCLLSFGAYHMFWFYRHWRYLRDEKNRDLSPGFRTLFLLFCGYTLFADFKKLARDKGYKKHPPLLLLFCLFSFVHFCVLTRDPAAFLLAWPSCFLLIPVVNMMNFYYRAEQPDRIVKSRLGWDDLLFLGIVWGLLVLSIMNS